MEPHFISANKNNHPWDAERSREERLNARKQNNLENYGGGTLAGGLSSLSVPAKLNFKGREVG